MYSWTQILFAVLIATTWTTIANSVECYEICSWSPILRSLEQAILIPADCTWTPSNKAWVQVPYEHPIPANDMIYLLIKLSDSHVDRDEGLFRPVLVFRRYDSSGKPVISTEYLTHQDIDPNRIKLEYGPPRQANILSLVQTSSNINAVVRLRHRKTNNCLTASNTNGARVTNWECKHTYNSDQLFRLVPADGDTFRLHHKNTNQCLYTSNYKVHHWGCWDDPNMRFKLIPSQGGYLLKHVSNDHCIYGNQASGGGANSWGCWHDPNMVYYIDVVVRPFLTAGPICDTASSGNQGADK